MFEDFDYNGDDLEIDPCYGCDFHFTDCGGVCSNNKEIHDYLINDITNTSNFSSAILQIKKARRKQMKKYVIDLIERAVRTGAQVAIAMIGTSQFICEVDWSAIVSAVSLSVVLSLLMSFVTLPNAKSGNASFMNNGNNNDK